MGGLIVVMALVVVVGPIVTVIHEVGHALAALALGRRVDMLAVGHHEDVTVTIGRTVLRFGRSLEGKPSGFITLDPESSPDEVIAIALLGPLANLGTAPLFAAAAQSAATSGPFESVLWWLAVVSVLVGIANLVPRGHDGQWSDGRMIQVAWAVLRGRPLPDLSAPEPTQPEPEPRTRWPFLVLLALAWMAALAVNAYEAALLLVLVFGAAVLRAATGRGRSRCRSQAGCSCRRAPGAWSGCGAFANGMGTEGEGWAVSAAPVVGVSIRPHYGASATRRCRRSVVVAMTPHYGA